MTSRGTLRIVKHDEPLRPEVETKEDSWVRWAAQVFAALEPRGAQSRLAEKMKVNPSTVTRLLRELRETGRLDMLIAVALSKHLGLEPPIQYIDGPLERRLMWAIQRLRITGVTDDRIELLVASFEASVAGVVKARLKKAEAEQEEARLWHSVMPTESTKP